MNVEKKIFFLILNEIKRRGRPAPEVLSFYLRYFLKKNVEEKTLRNRIYNVNRGVARHWDILFDMCRFMNFDPEEWLLSQNREVSKKTIKDTLQNYRNK